MDSRGLLRLRERLARVMLSCKAAAKLMSERLDRKLRFWQRLGSRLHVMLCSACSAYKRQVEALDKVIRNRYGPEPHDGVSERLSDDALRKIKASVKSHAP